MMTTVTAQQLRSMGGLEGLNRKGLAAVPVPAKTERKQATAPRPARRAPHQVGRMNKLEARYLAEVLEPLRQRGEIIAILFEGVKLKLADTTFYSPDFVVVTPERIEIHEVKGRWEDDARVKWKVAAEQHWWLHFVAATRPKTGWKIETYGKEG